MYLANCLITTTWPPAFRFAAPHPNFTAPAQTSDKLTMTTYLLSRYVGGDREYSWHSKYPSLSSPP